MGEVIGEGKFGIVRKALYNENITVAVKSLKGLKDSIGSFTFFNYKRISAIVSKHSPQNKYCRVIQEICYPGRFFNTEGNLFV